VPSRRRAVLAGFGAVVTGLAGCSGVPTDSPTPTSTSPAPTDATLGESVAVGDVTVTVSDPVAAHSVRYLTAPDAAGVATAGDDQFLFVDVSVRGEGPTPARDAFALVADGTRYEPGIEAVGPARVDGPVTGPRYDDAEGGYLAFRVPAPLDAEETAVVTDTVRWTIPSGRADPLRSPPPSFSTTVDVPDAVPVDEPIPIRLDVDNEGDGDGVFRGVVNHQGPLYSFDTFDLPVAAGESTTHETTVDYHLDAESPPGRVQFAVVGPDVSRSVRVTVDGGGTPAGTAARRR